MRSAARRLSCGVEAPSASSTRRSDRKPRAHPRTAALRDARCARLDAHATWRDGEETLATVAARSPANWRGWTSGLVLDLDASVLPGEPGARRATARLAGAELRDGVAHFELPELGRALNDVYRRAGLTLSKGADRLDAMLAGPLDAEGRFSGPVT